MIGRRIVRVLRVLGLAVASLVLAVALLVGFLRFTNPSPAERPGWTLLSPMPNPRGEVAAANVGARLVVAGGFRGLGRPVRDVHVYEVERERWSSGRPLPEPRHHAAAAASDGSIYVSGGAGRITVTEGTDTVWRARPGESWERVEPMPEPRIGHAMVAFDGKLYVVGGIGPTSRTLVYHPEREPKWAFAAPLPIPRDHLRAVVLDDEIWVIGGRTRAPTRRVDVYEPDRDSWRRGPDLPGPASAMAVGVLEGAIHVIGGEDPDLSGGVLDDHFVLPPGARAWRTRPPPMLPVHGAGYGVLGDRLFIAGGASRQGALSVLSWTGATQVLGP